MSSLGEKRKETLLTELATLDAWRLDAGWSDTLKAALEVEGFPAVTKLLDEGNRKMRAVERAFMALSGNDDGLGGEDPELVFLEHTLGLRQAMFLAVLAREWLTARMDRVMREAFPEGELLHDSQEKWQAVLAAMHKEFDGRVLPGFPEGVHPKLVNLVGFMMDGVSYFQLHGEIPTYPADRVANFEIDQKGCNMVRAVDPNWRWQAGIYASTGDASAEYLKHLEGCAICKAATAELHDEGIRVAYESAGLTLPTAQL